MANPSLFQSTPGQALPATDQVNQAGGRAFAFTSKHALAQYAVTGCFNSTFYASAQTQLKDVLRLAGAVEPEFLAKTALYCRQQAQMKDMPSLLCAALATLDTALLARVFDRVINDGKMLRNFVQIVRSGVCGRKSLGSAPKRLVKEWLAKQSDEQIFRASVGQKPSLADVIKMVHPRPNGEQRKALYAWLIGAAHDEKALPELVRQFEAFKLGAAGVPNVPFQMLTSLDLNTKAWQEIARSASWQVTRMNLNTFARHGVFRSNELVRTIANRLRNSGAVRRARCFPYQLLTSFHSLNADVPKGVRLALQDAMEIAIENVPQIAGKVVVCPDVSGSMQSPVTGVRVGATTATRCIDVAALVAAAMLRKNSEAVVLPFSDDVIPCELNPRDSVMTNAHKLGSLPSGGTNCSAPLRWLNRKSARADLVVIASDNMSWVDSNGGGHSTATMQEWTHFRSRNPNARLVCLDLQPYANTQAKEQADILNIGGFSDAVFEIIATFANGTLGSDHWVGLIESVEL